MTDTLENFLSVITFLSCFPQFMCVPVCFMFLKRVTVTGLVLGDVGPSGDDQWPDRKTGSFSRVQLGCRDCGPEKGGRPQP